MWVKICGITNLEDARTAVEAGADAVGFVFYDKSPRNVNTDTVREITAHVPQGIERVGVFVDQTAEEIRETVKLAGLSAVQIHKTDSLRQDSGATGVLARPAVAQDLAGESNGDELGMAKLIVAISGNHLADGGFFMGDAAKKRVFAIMIDSGNATNPGGTGRTFDWEQARGMVQGISLAVPVIVAGGLTPANVAEAVKQFQPFGVDVSSGVEARAGKKDPDKVRAFVQAARQAEKKE
jgi:phosphoribosylanthranilate isomerase